MPTLAQSLARSPPLLVVAAGLVVGDAAAGRWPMPYGVAAIASIALGVAVLLYRPGLARRGGLFILACSYGALAAEHVYRPGLSATHVVQFAGRAPVAVEGRLDGDPVARGERVAFYVSVQHVDSGRGWQAASGLIRLTVRHVAGRWLDGDRIRVRTTLRQPRNFGTPGEFDYVAHLARRQVYVTGYVDDDASIELVARADRGFGTSLVRWRQRVGDLIDATLAPTAAAVLRALIIGKEDGISNQLRQAFSRAGVSHVLSISGLHVGLVASAAYATQRWLLARSEWLLLASNVPKLAVVSSIVPVLLYANIAGSNVATTRSVVMILVFLGAVVVDRRRHLMVSLAVAAIGVIVTAPGSSLDISFQLSFVAVWALALANQRFWAWWPGFAELRLLRLRTDWRARLWRPLLLYAVVSSSALAATTPLTALHFNQVSLIAPLANLLVVPVLGSAAVMLGLLAAFCEPLSHGLAGLVVRLAGICVTLGVWLVEHFAALPGAALRLPTPRLGELLLSYVLLGLVLYASGRTRRIGVALALVLMLVDIVNRCVFEDTAGELRVTFLSIGQGDAAVVEMPDGKVAVIDGGGIGDGSFDVGERVIAPFLWWRGITRVDIVSISHPQFDHFGGLRFVVQQFAPREVWTSGRVANGTRYEQLAGSLRDNAVRAIVLRAGNWRDYGDVRIRVRGPSEANPAHDLNNDSLVLQLEYAGRRVLMTGDIEAPAETQLLQSSAGLASDVLKVPHHGSRTSSTPAFLAAVSPHLAVVSAGFQNRFGFPDAHVVRRYLAHGSIVARTDIDGAVEVRIGKDGAVRYRRYARGQELTVFR